MHGIIMVRYILEDDPRSKRKARQEFPRTELPGFQNKGSEWAMCTSVSETLQRIQRASVRKQ